MADFRAAKHHLDVWALRLKQSNNSGAGNHVPDIDAKPHNAHRPGLGWAERGHQGVHDVLRGAVDGEFL